MTGHFCARFISLETVAAGGREIPGMPALEAGVSGLAGGSRRMPRLVSVSSTYAVVAQS